MNRQLVFGFLLIIFLISVSASASIIQPIKATPVTIVVPDDYATLQDAISHALDGDTVYVRSGIYYEHVLVNKTVSLVGEDADTTIIDGSNTGHVVYIVSDNVNITGFTVQKSGNVHMPALEAGICLNDSVGCVVSGNRLIDNGFCGISLLYSQQNMIIGNNITRSSWGGIHLLASSNNIVSKNIVGNTFGAINGHVSSNYNNFTENIISNSTHGMFYHASSRNNICRNNISHIAVEGIWLQDQVNYNVVAENNLVNNTVAIRLQGPNYYNTLSRNVITDAEYGVKIEAQANSNVVSGNIITGCQFGIQVLNARYTEISNNTIAHNYGSDWDAGIRLDSAGYSRIHSNLITDNWRGILLYTSSPYVSIYNNNVTDNEYAIRVASGGSRYVNVTGNYVANNRGYGIGLTGFGGGGGSNYATIARNLIVNNTLEAIGLGQGSNYNTIVQNTMIENGYGIYFDLVGYSTQNTIFNNNIINNTQQVRIAPGSVNEWDDGYPSGGNYWSDYVGVDVKSGSGQDLAGSDGLGDIPCIIDSNNVDHYPLMNPYGAPPPSTYTLTITTTVGGTTDPVAGTYSYTVNSTVEVTAIPEANYSLNYWELDSSNVGSANPCTVPMDKDHALKAVFSLIPSLLSVSISPLSVSINVGQSVTFTSTVSGGYTPYVYQWHLNGHPVSGATSNTWSFTPTTSGIYYIHLEVIDAKTNTAQSDTARIAVAAVPIGGYSIPTQSYSKAKLQTPYLILISALTIAFTTIKRKTTRKPKQQ